MASYMYTTPVIGVDKELEKDCVLIRCSYMNSNGSVMDSHQCIELSEYTPVHHSECYYHER